ncbi:MAG: PA14 domain-containing protein, partial [Planctomycetota bacterium]|nr:PA14 domain-containing protein [Planctomycetota bacterium]
ATGTVYVTILPPRPADSAALTAPGLLADYFFTLPNSVTELPLGTPDGTTTAATVDFPSSDQPIAGGTRQAGVGLIITGSITVPAAASYTFYLESDDGSALYINNQLILINDGPQGMTEIAGTMTLAAGTYPVRIEYVQGGGNAGLIARVSSASVAKQVIPASWWGPAGVTINRLALGGTFADLPTPGTLSVARRGVVLQVNQADNSQPLFSSTRGTNVAMSMRGYFNAPQTAMYRFFLTSDDASELRIGTQVVVNNRGAHGMIERAGTVALAAGLHQLSIEYWQGGGGAGLVASVESSAMAKQAIPASMLVHAVADCDGDGQDDAAAVVEAIDLGDIAVGGSGRGSGTLGAGVVPSTGRLVATNVSGGTRTGGSAVFLPLNGVNGRANFPMVEGVFVPNASTTYIVGQAPFLFSPTSGSAFDAIRNGFGYFDGTTLAPIVLADQPSVARRGLGMHANSGLTFDLVQVRAANPGRSVLGVRGVAGLLRDGCAGRDAAAELYVLVDGIVAYRSVLTDDALAQAFDVSIAGGAQFLTLAMLDARTNNCDHFAIADAKLLLSTPVDENLDGIPDSCQCPADFNRDGGVDGGDVEAFFTAWESSAPEADTNGDGGVDGSDVEAFFVAWEAGGC